MTEATLENQGSHKFEKIEKKSCEILIADSWRNVAELLDIVLTEGW